MVLWRECKHVLPAVTVSFATKRCWNFIDCFRHFPRFTDYRNNTLLPWHRRVYRLTKSSYRGLLVILCSSVKTETQVTCLKEHNDHFCREVMFKFEDLSAGIFLFEPSRQQPKNRERHTCRQTDRQTDRQQWKIMWQCVRVRAWAGKERSKEGKKVLPHRKNLFQFMLDSGESEQLEDLLHILGGNDVEESESSK